MMKSMCRTYSLLLSVLFTIATYGQSTPPEWFTYPKKGEYVGVSVSLDEKMGHDCEMKSAVMSALISYFLQCEMREVGFKSASQSIQTDSEEYGDQQTRLFWKNIIGYELVRMEKDAEGRVWVSIKPITEQTSHDMGVFSMMMNKSSNWSDKNNSKSVQFVLDLTCCYHTLMGDSVNMNLSWSEAVNGGSPQPRQAFKYHIATNRSLGSVGLDGKAKISKDKSDGEDAPIEWMKNQASSKGYVGDFPYVASYSDLGGSYLLALSEALLSIELYVLNDSNEVEYKKPTKTVATFFHGDACFMYNNCVGGVTK
ncbi:MAG: hypothetical protein IJ013_02030 [Bacteroidaceae bacterium]|nr:hypothetical protein [Bacteroidaceae bacterium]